MTCHSGTCHSGACHSGACDSGTCHRGTCHSGACHRGACHRGACHSGACHSGACHRGACHSGACHRGACDSGACNCRMSHIYNINFERSFCSSASNAIIHFVFRCSISFHTPIPKTTPSTISHTISPARKYRTRCICCSMVSSYNTINIFRKKT